MKISYARAAEKLPDDAATPDDLNAIRDARAEYADGKTVPHDAIDWNENSVRQKE